MAREDYEAAQKKLEPYLNELSLSLTIDAIDVSGIDNINSIDTGGIIVAAEKYVLYLNELLEKGEISLYEGIVGLSEFISINRDSIKLPDLSCGLKLDTEGLDPADVKIFEDAYPYLVDLFQMIEDVYKWGDGMRADIMDTDPNDEDKLHVIHNLLIEKLGLVAMQGNILRCKAQPQFQAINELKTQYKVEEQLLPYRRGNSASFMDFCDQTTPGFDEAYAYLKGVLLDDALKPATKVRAMLAFRQNGYMLRTKKLPMGMGALTFDGVAVLTDEQVKPINKKFIERGEGEKKVWVLLDVQPYTQKKAKDEYNEYMKIFKGFKIGN